MRPTPISKVSHWAQSQAIEEVYGIAAEALNDDRIGRALDEIHPHLVDPWTAIVWKGADTYHVRLDQLHSDVTRIAFEGSYDAPAPPDQDSTGPRITSGFTGNEDPTRKRLTVSVSATADGDQPAIVALGALVPKHHLYRHLDAVLDLAFVHDWDSVDS